MVCDDSYLNCGEITYITLITRMEYGYLEAEFC